MERRVIGNIWEKIIPDDYNNVGLFPQSSFDSIVGKLLIPDIAFSGFEVVQSGLAEVTVGNGHLMSSGLVYVNDQTGGVTVDLLPRRAVATKRIVVIGATGTEFDTDTVPRTFLTDADTRTTIAQPVATTHVRWANIIAVSGMENANPLPPAVATNVCPIAYILMSTTGIESVTMAEAYRVPTLREVDSRLNEYDIWKKIVGTRLDTLAADLLALAAKIFGLAPFSFVLHVAEDVVRLKLMQNLPQTYVNWAADNFMGEQYSQTDDAAYLAKVEEGLKPAPAAESDSQLGLLDINDPSVINTNNVLLPRWVEVSRITNKGSDAQLPLNRYQYQTLGYVQKQMTRARYRYGPEFVITQNQLSQFLHIGGFTRGADGRPVSNPAGVWDPIENAYRMNSGEVFAVLGTYRQVIATSWNGHAHSVVAPATENQTMIRLAQRFVDYYDEPYWSFTTSEGSVSGAAIGQSFLNSQDGWLCGVDFFFSAVGSVGDVLCVLCETMNGAPDLTKVLATSSVAVGDLEISPAASLVSNSADGTPPNVEGMVPTRFNFNPTYLTQGRYAFVLITSGTHSLWELVDTNYISGTLFYSTDGAWFLGDLAHDLAFQAYFCKFSQNTTQTQLLPLQLTGGIAAIDVLAQAILPSSTHMFYEIQVGGNWVSLEDLATSPATILSGLPATLPFRVNFIGTDSVQPCLGVAANSRVRCYRPRNDFTHISTVRTFDSSCATVTARCVVNNWLGAHHTFTAKLLHGASYSTTRNPDTVTTEVNPDDPANSLIYHFTWNGMGAIDSCRFRLEGTTDNLLTPFVVSERIDVDIT